MDQDAGSDGNLGTPDWDDAFATLQKALSEAEPGDEIWVAASEDPYVPSAQVDPNDIADDIASVYGPDAEARMPTFKLVKNVGIYGGFLGNAHPSGGETSLSEADPENNITILSGELGSAGNSDNAYHVLLYYQDNDDNEPPDPLQLIVDGFTITGGNANGGDTSGATTQGALNAMGGGALIVYEAHFEFLGGSADPDFDNALAPVFSRCVFESNVAALAGGAISGVYNGGRAIDCTFITNEQNATSGAQYGSKANRGGGAINVLGPIALLKSTFIENESVAVGGAVQYSGTPGETDPTVVISNCTFQENTALNGGGVYELAGPVVNCLFVGNSATGTNSEGGGVNSIDGGVHGCTFVRNSSVGVGAGAANSGRITNCIFWDNAISTTAYNNLGANEKWRAQVEMEPTSDNDYNLIEEWVCTGSCTATHNIDDEPLFSDEDGPDDDPDTFEDNDYRLADQSPAIDSGDPDLDNDDDNGYYPRDQFDIDDDGITDVTTPYEITPPLDDIEDIDRVEDDRITAARMKCHANPWPAASVTA